MSYQKKRVRMRYEFTIAWDGEPSMSGEPHRFMVGSFSTLDQARQALRNLPSAKTHPERNYRIEARQISDWVQI